MDDMYKIIGDIKISNERKEEFNSYILNLLKVGGIRRIEEICLNGQYIKVVEYPTPDENGIVSFNYSIFERKEREMAYYDTNSCQLTCEDRGYMEYGVVMNLLMTMQMAYSELPCFLMYEDEPCRLWGYAVCVEQLLGLKLDFTNRSDCWENLLLFRRYGYVKNDVVKTCLAIPDEFSRCICKNLFAAVYSRTEIRIPKDYPENEFWKIEKETNHWIAAGIGNIMKKCVETDGVDTVRVLLKKLLSSKREERGKLFEKENIYWFRLAELSLYEMPPVFIRAFAMITGEEFWEIWDSFNIEGYDDIIEFDYTEEEKNTNVEKQIFWFIIKKDEGMCKLEFLSIDELAKFKDAEGFVKLWKEQYERIPGVLAEEIETEAELLDILMIQKTFLGTCYIAKTVVNEFLDNIGDIRYRKAVYLYKQLLEEDLKAFPEMTRSQVFNHVLRYTNMDKKRSEVQAYAALLCNIALRKEIFGF